MNLLAQSVYDNLIDSGMDIPTLPLENVVLVTAFGRRSNRVKKQAMMKFSVGEDLFEVNFFITPQLVNDAILGYQLMKEYGIILNCEKESFIFFREGILREHLFNQSTGPLEVGRGEQYSEKTDILTHTHTGQYPTTTLADCKPFVSLLETHELPDPTFS